MNEEKEQEMFIPEPEVKYESAKYREHKSFNFGRFLLLLPRLLLILSYVIVKILLFLPITVLLVLTIILTVVTLFLTFYVTKDVIVYLAKSYVTINTFTNHWILNQILRIKFIFSSLPFFPEYENDYLKKKRDKEKQKLDRKRTNKQDKVLKETIKIRKARRTNKQFYPLRLFLFFPHILLIIFWFIAKIVSFILAMIPTSFYIVLFGMGGIFIPDYYRGYRAFYKLFASINHITNLLIVRESRKLAFIFKNDPVQRIYLDKLEHKDAERKERRERVKRIQKLQKQEKQKAKQSQKEYIKERKRERRGIRSISKIDEKDAVLEEYGTIEIIDSTEISQLESDYVEEKIARKQFHPLRLFLIFPRVILIIFWFLAKVISFVVISLGFIFVLGAFIVVIVTIIFLETAGDFVSLIKSFVKAYKKVNRVTNNQIRNESRKLTFIFSTYPHIVEYMEQLEEKSIYKKLEKTKKKHLRKQIRKDNNEDRKEKKLEKRIEKKIKKRVERAEITETITKISDYEDEPSLISTYSQGIQTEPSANETMKEDTYEENDILSELKEEDIALKLKIYLQSRKGKKLSVFNLVDYFNLPLSEIEEVLIDLIGKRLEKVYFDKESGIITVD